MSQQSLTDTREKVVYKWRYFISEIDHYFQKHKRNWWITGNFYIRTSREYVLWIKALFYNESGVWVIDINMDLPVK